MDSNFSQKVRLHFTFHALLDACIYDNQIFITGFGNDMLHLTVSCNDGEQISVSLSKHSMGHEVAQVIFAKKGIPPSQQRLALSISHSYLMPAYLIKILHQIKPSVVMYPLEVDQVTIVLAYIIKLLLCT